jgi:hypothetical protein
MSIFKNLFIFFNMIPIKVVIANMNNSKVDNVNVESDFTILIHF